MTINADDLPQFMQCNGSRQMPESFPSVPGTAQTIRDEGIAVHWLASSVMNGQFGDAFELVDRKSPNGVYITPEMAEHVSTYVERLNARNYAMRHVEFDTSFGDIAARMDHGGITYPTIFEQSHNQTGTLYIDDMKYGYGIVEPDFNWTLIAHAIGYAERAAEANVQFSHVELSIYQPRVWHYAGQFRTWLITYAELMQLRERLVDSVIRPLDELRTGPLCVKCKAFATCPAARQAGYNMLDATDIVFTDDLPAEALSALYDQFKYASKFITAKAEALEELITHRLKNGQPTGDYALEPTFGNRKWNSGLTPDVLRMILGERVVKPAVLTPSQLIKLGVDETIVESLSSRPSTGTKLIRESADARARRLLKGNT